MNSLRKDFDIYGIPKRALTSYRVLGFVDDGTFCISNLTPVFSIKQHYKNVHFLHEIGKLPEGVYILHYSSILNVSNIL